jgi:hypothetical protein
MPGMTSKFGIVRGHCFLVFFLGFFGFLFRWRKEPPWVWSRENFGGGGSWGFESYVFFGFFGFM